MHICQTVKTWIFFVSGWILSLGLVFLASWDWLEVLIGRNAFQTSDFLMSSIVFIVALSIGLRITSQFSEHNQYLKDGIEFAVLDFMFKAIPIIAFVIALCVVA